MQAWKPADTDRRFKAKNLNLSDFGWFNRFLFLSQDLNGSCVPGWPQPCYVAKTDLKLLFLLPPPPKYRTQFIYGAQDGTRSFVGKHNAKASTSPALLACF